MDGKAAQTRVMADVNRDERVYAILHAVPDDCARALDRGQTAVSTLVPGTRWVVLPIRAA